MHISKSKYDNSLDTKTLHFLKTAFGALKLAGNSHMLQYENISKRDCSQNKAEEGFILSHDKEYFHEEERLCKAIPL